MWLAHFHFSAQIVMPANAGISDHTIERTEDGGIWRLDMSGSARRYLGMRVTIEGRRSDFDLLDVNRICRVDRPIEGPIHRQLTFHRLRRFGFD